MRRYVSSQIDRYLSRTGLLREPEESGKLLQVSDDFRMEIVMLKELTWHYVIDNPSLGGQQHGQRQVIRSLFTTYLDAALTGRWAMLPVGYREEAVALPRENGKPRQEDLARIVADMISGMTDDQAIVIYRRLTGHLPGSALDRLWF